MNLLQAYLVPALVSLLSHDSGTAELCHMVSRDAVDNIVPPSTYILRHKLVRK